MELSSPDIWPQSETLVAYMGRYKGDYSTGFSYSHAQIRASEELPATATSSGAFLFFVSIRISSSREGH